MSAGRRKARIQIGTDDLMVWRGVRYKLFGRKDSITHLQRLDYPDIKEPFTAEQLEQMWDHNQFSHYPGHFAIGGAMPARVAGPNLMTLRPKAKAFTLRKLAFVQMFIRGHAKGEYKRTYESAAKAAKDFQPVVDGLGRGVPEALKTITSEHSPAPRKRRVGNDKPLVVDGEVIHPGKEEPCGETLLRDVWKFEKAFGDPMSLRPLYENCGYHGSHLAPEVEAIVTRCMSKWLSREKLGPAAILDLVEGEIDDYNAVLDVEAGDKALTYPSIDTINHAIDQIDPFYACVCREGEDIAELKYGWMKEGLEVKAPGQRVEVDAYRVDLMTLLCWSGAWEGLNRHERRNLKRKRVWLTIAIDKATRCILAMRLSRTPNAPNAVATLAMIECDKTIYSDAAGTESSWNQRTGVMTLVMDGGYVSDEVRAAMSDARGTVEYPEAGDPTMRGTIERIFRTVATQLIARLRGKTFSDIFERGNYESAERAGLTEDELAWILVTWVVDIYHNTPHEGLKGKTPAQAWEDAIDTYHVRPWRDAHGRRSAFGVRLKRSLTANGFEFLGNFYRDDDLDEGLKGKRFHSKQKEYVILVDVSNLGAISFIDGDRAIALPCQDPAMEGVHVSAWMATTQQVRAENAHRTQVPRGIAHRALKRILEINEAAGRRATIVDPVYSPEDLEHFERLYFKSFRYADPTPAERSGVMGEVIPPVDIATISTIVGQRPEQEFARSESDGAVDARTHKVPAPVPTTGKPAQPSKKGKLPKPVPSPNKTFDLED